MSGARVWAWIAGVGRWVLATARRIIRRGGGLGVRLDFDDWDDPRLCPLSSDLLQTAA